MRELFEGVLKTIGNTPLVRLQRIPGPENARRGNVILGNTNCDLWVEASGVFGARFNSWDTATPSRGTTCAGGIDIGERQYESFFGAAWTEVTPAPPAKTGKEKPAAAAANASDQKAASFAADMGLGVAVLSAIPAGMWSMTTPGTLSMPSARTLASVGMPSFVQPRRL